MGPDTQAYIAVMQEIKRRTALVYALLDRRETVMFEITTVETMILQVRMITELIALASLASNRAIFEAQKRKFEKHWDPVQILKDVEKLNPHFYPRPVVELPSMQSGVKTNMVDRPDDYLTRTELIEVHGKCGNVLHARNPYRAPHDYELYESLVEQWMERIMRLLNSHTIRLLDEDTFHLVHMKAEDGDHVRIYTFSKNTGPDSLSEPAR